MQTNTIISELIEKINDFELEGESFEAIFAYNEKVSPVPINKTYIAFSTDSTAINFFNDENLECCKRTTVTITADFYSASNRKAKDIYSLMESVMDFLLVEYAGRMTDYHAGKLEIDDNLRLLKLPCSMTFTYEQCPAYSVGGDVILPFADFLCKTHATDTSIHLTQSEKAFVESPYVIGTYIGDGEDVKKIVLGFRPSFLFLFRAASAGVGYLNNELSSFFAFGIGTKTSKGLSFLSTGFRVEFGDDISSNGVKPNLNSTGQTYCYIALK